MKFEKVNMPLNENLYNKLNNMCIFNNLKLEYKNGIIFKVADTNVNFIEPHRFIIKVNDIALVLLCYDNLNLCLYDKDIIVNVSMIKELVNKIRENNYERREFEVTLLSTLDYYLFSETEIKAGYYNLIKHIK